ncbi:MAG: class I SAM-dependent methyltransferase [Cyclobacteriaceae bacterium]|nr:class I SAM-dependent methyltransferase [Cyclobacteriaceae bacterium]UYN88189.1 MAG: class I SAM-dependent methyltransferase [Cyclobacteriaceae bacterium]
MVFTKQYPTETEERERYRFHNNTIENHGYVTFLYQAITPALPYLKGQQHGLDYGCGPEPVLSKLLEQNHSLYCKNYDPLFFRELPSGKFDFIFSTECFEHFHNPAKEIVHIKKLLEPGGVLVVMTALWNETLNLSTWHYLRDITHVCVFHSTTFDYVCQQFGFVQLYNDSRRVVILRSI